MQGIKPVPVLCLFAAIVAACGSQPQKEKEEIKLARPPAFSSASAVEAPRGLMSESETSGAG